MVASTEYRPKVIIEGMGEDTQVARQFVNQNLVPALYDTGTYMDQFIPGASESLKDLEVRVAQEGDPILGGYVNPSRPRRFNINGDAIRSKSKEGLRFLWHTFRHEPIHNIQAMHGIIQKYSTATVEFFTDVYSRAFRKISPRLEGFGRLIGFYVAQDATKEIIEGSTSLAEYEASGGIESGDAYGARGWRGRIRRVARSLADRFYNPNPDKLGRRIVFNPRDVGEAKEVVKEYSRKAGLLPAFA